MSALQPEPLELRLYDSAVHAVVPLAPTAIPGVVKIYLCGATVQGSPHIGHMRSAIAFDVLRRWLERCGQQVVLIRNVTDIDDKILAKSAAADPPVPWWAWAQRHEREFDAAYRALGVQPPTYEPRATGHIPEMIDLISRLIERGHAYVGSPGNVYFDVASLPGYGSLTNQRPQDLTSTEEESQVDAAVEAGKRDPRDFALWKAVKVGEPADAAWDTPWGRGRPGWHLECSAMSHRYLGEEFDIHGGGIDLRFPHHENEQAQSHGAGWGFAKHWVHNAWVTIKGEKMSKSLGNSLVVSELLCHHEPAVLRLALGTVHHRSTVEFSEESLADAAALWERLTGALLRAREVSTAIDAADTAALRARALPTEFTAAMNEDLNLAGAMTVVHATLKRLNMALANSGQPGAAHAGFAAAQDASDAATSSTATDSSDLVTGTALDLRAQLDVLGLDPLAEPWRASVLGAGGASGADAAMSALDHLVTVLIGERAQARAARDWARADALRDQLTAAGVVVEDSASGARWHLG
ncbi:cysteine--tRNA ligase [Actinomyces trachealis]|uniref:cysteine--tRNA ligase n=1 Tax=Actinomyces trachealis TaxID=2763540 RepID=UPI0018C542C0|nr:cysteine--tRNA ligase [Actinomyces trachealis]